MWHISNVTQSLVQLESDPPYDLLGVDKDEKLTMINAPTASRTEDPGKHQIICYQVQSLHSNRAMALIIDTLRDCMVGMMLVDFQPPFKTIKALGNSRHKETDTQHSKLGR